MHLNSVTSHNTAFRGSTTNDSNEQKRITNPINSGKEIKDIFVSTTKMTIGGGLFGKLANKVKEVANQVTESVTGPALQQKVNAAKLTKLMVENGTFNSYFEAIDEKDFINELAKQDYETIEKKYTTIVKNVKRDGVKPNTTSYSDNLGTYALKRILTYDKLQAEDIDALYELKRNRPADPNPNIRNDLYINRLISTMKAYENFDNLPASSQKEFIDRARFRIKTSSTITRDEAQEISDYSSLMKFDYFKDLKAAESQDNFANTLDVRRRNIPCKAINTSVDDIKNAISKEGIKNLENALNNTDLTKYEKGFNLEYSRDNFIKDFKTLTNDLSNEDKKKVYETFQFKINTADDIVNYPNPDIEIENIDENIKDTVLQGQELINKFILENKFKLNPEDKALEKELNNIIKAFPEFTSIVGKIQHRGDSIDYHTMDDLKRIYNNPNFQELPEQEQRILTVATLFHDFGKVQDETDDGHARKSAFLAKEILKKMPTSYDEKERIFNLINHSHWLVEEGTTEDIGFIFRRPNDFKMAEIFEEADSNSAGFPYEPNADKLKEIRENIDRINTSGIPLFVHSLPTEDKFYDITPSGVKYLDLRDPEMSAEKYGYPTGTKVKDLKFLCHASSDGGKDFEALCDDSKEICLSTSLMDYRSHYRTGYNSGGAYIVSGNNANIVLGGKDVACTGGHRGYDYAKDGMYQRGYDYMSRTESEEPKKDRQYISNIIKENLDLSDNEYLEIYENICNLENKEDIENMTLSNGRKISSKELQTVISDIQNEMVRPKEKGEGSSYINEFVVYNPKIEATVLWSTTPDDLDHFPKDKVYVLT